MTIAAGFVCSDGIVMCADSQEVQQDFKWPVKKLVIPTFSIGNTRIVISGAGFGPAIDNATQRILRRVSFDSLESILNDVRDILKDIHENDLPNHPLTKVDPTFTQFRLLMAIHGEDNRKGLYVTDGSLINSVQFFEIVGSGEITKYFAHMMYRRTRLLEMPLTTMSEGTVLSAYLIHLAKNQLSSIGGKSQIATISNDGDIRLANEWHLPRMEKFFDDFQWNCGQVMLDCADADSSEEKFSWRLDKHVLALKAAKRALIEDREELDRLFKPFQDQLVTGVQGASRPSSVHSSKDQQ